VDILWFKDKLVNVLDMLTIYYNAFWPGIDIAMNKVFERVFGQPVQMTENWLEADVLCENLCQLYESFLLRKKWTYSFLVSFEFHLGQMAPFLSRYSCVLSGLPNGANHVKLPFVLECILREGLKDTVRSIVPSKLVSAVIKNRNGSQRNAFLDAADAVVRVDYGGQYRNNIGGPIPGIHCDQTLIDFYKQYKFVIAMENTEHEYYITEKIFNAIKAGVIPIYWGSPHVCKYFNKNRFIHLENTSPAEIARVLNKMQTMTDAEYLEMVNQPIFARPLDELLMDTVRPVQSLLSIV
jgi:hypothetical protein